LAFLSDITGHLNELNKRLQGKEQLVHEMYQHVRAFEVKLRLWHTQMEQNNSAHFKLLSEQNMPNFKKYADIISRLLTSFESRFLDFKNSEIEYKIFATPFSVDVGILPVHLQLECIDLQADVPLIKFYKDHLSKEKFPALYDHALFMTSLFGSTYVCEQFFSRMKHTKNKLRTNILDENLESELRVSCTCIEPDIEKLVREKQAQVSH